MKREVSRAAAPSGMTGVSAVPVLAWKPCDDGFQCVTTRVPLNYRDLGGAPTSITVISRKAAGPGRRRNTARRVSLILPAAMAAGMTLASCSSPTGPSGPTGTLTGTLQAVGGHPGTGPRALAGGITLHGANGAKVGIVVGADGRFSVSVTVGTYTVIGQSPQYEGGTADCHASGPVTVTEGVTSRIEVDCQE